VAGIGAGAGLGAPVVPIGGTALVALLAATRTSGVVARCLVVLGFACLGMARAVDVGAGPPLPAREGLLLWEVQVARSGRGGDTPVAVSLKSARASPGGGVLWQGEAPARLWIPRWPVDDGLARRGERWLVRGRIRPARRAGAPSLGVSDHRRACLLRPAAGPSQRLAGGWDAALLSLRGRVRRAVDQHAPEQHRALLLALSLGDRRELDPALREAFARTGTAHLLAISGLHVGCFAGALLMVLRFAVRRLPLPLDARQAGLPDRLAWGGALLGAWLYVAVAGAPVSGRRALVMLACVAAGRIVRRRTSGWNGLAGAALLVAWFEPEAVRSAGYQLSVASVAGLLALWPEAGTGQVGRVRRWVARAAASSAAATLATAPLCAGLFGRVAVAGLWVNLLAIPVLAFGVVPPLLAGAALGAIEPALGGPAIRLAGLSAELGCRLVCWLAAPDRCPVLLWAPRPGAVWAAYLLGAVAIAAWSGDGRET